MFLFIEAFQLIIEEGRTEFESHNVASPTEWIAVGTGHQQRETTKEKVSSRQIELESDLHSGSSYELIGNTEDRETY